MYIMEQNLLVFLMVGASRGFGCQLFALYMIQYRSSPEVPSSPVPPTGPPHILVSPLVALLSPPFGPLHPG